MTPTNPSTAVHHTMSRLTDTRAIYIDVPHHTVPKQTDFQLNLYQNTNDIGPSQAERTNTTQSMAASVVRVAIATGASLAVHLFVKSFLQAQHPALTLLLPVAVFAGIAVGAKGGNGGDGKAPPGPAAVPVFGNWLQVGNDLNHRFLAAMSARYGPVFRLRLGVRNLVVVSDPKLATEQYKAMWEAEMDAVVDDVRGDAVAQGTGFVVRRRLQLMLYNIMYRMMFDARFESVDDPMFIEATRFNSERSRLAQSFEYNYGDFIPILRPFLRGYLNKCRDLQSRRLAFFNNNYVEKRRKVMDTPGDRNKLRCAIDHILEAEKNGELTAENVIYIVENINVAAIETTLWSIEWALAEVVNHPAVQSKVRAEINDVLGDDEPITESNIHKLTYLQAVIKETLRLHSPIPLLLVRSFEMVPPPGVEKLDVSEKGGQFSLHIAKHSVLATEVLHTQGVEFGSRPRNVVFDIFTANGADMVFTEYGDHWRRMRRAVIKETLRLHSPIPLLVPHMNLEEAKLGGYTIPKGSKVVAVIKETLRLHSPIPLLVPHMNLEEAKLGGYTIPKGSKVVVNAWWLANNPALWENPEDE
uniref:Uncharacterized protein n=1 Tax=Oryza rufipogon TaxID=4529 RepID=A0A0E0NEM8_ORYRU